jgi:dihydroflavonol-4-reductase
MRSAFITGASGFIGRRLVESLRQKNVSVKCLVRPTSKVTALQKSGVELVVGAIDQPQSYAAALRGCDTIFHLAGLTHSTDREALYRINSDSCGFLASACAELDSPPRVVYVSSVAAAGPPPQGKQIRDECDPAAPVSDYGRSKWQGEQQWRAFADKLDITIVRPGIVYGPGDTVLAELIRSIYRWRLHVVIGFQTPPLSLIHVDDVVGLIIDAAGKGETIVKAGSTIEMSQGVYFACDDSAYPNYWSFGQQIARSLDRSVFVLPLWRWVGRSVAWTVQTSSRLLGKHAFLTVDKIREATVRSWAVSGEKARQHLGFRPSRSLPRFTARDNHMVR